MEKDFKGWFILKERLDNSSADNPLFRDGEVWWCSVGVNVGVEVDGKDRLYSRPIIILRKLSRNCFYRPTTDKQCQLTDELFKTLKNRLKILLDL